MLSGRLGAYIGMMLCLVMPSCHDDVVPEGNVALRFDIQVSDYADAHTRALKSRWNSGEKIQIWYDGNVQTDPDVVIQYDGSQWQAEPDSRTPSSSAGTMKALCYADNGMILCSTGQPYQYADGVLTGRIDNWRFLTRLHITVSEVTDNQSAYTLSCSALSAPGEVTVGTDDITMTTVSGAPVTGLENADGVGFVFADCTGFDVETEYLFELISPSSNPLGKSSSNAIFTKTVADPVNSFRGIKFSKDAFSAPGNKGRTWGYDWVQLVEGGKKFATENLQGYYTLEDAILACEDIGDGWRLMREADVSFSPTTLYTTSHATDSYTVTGKAYGNSITFSNAGFINASGILRQEQSGYYWLGDGDVDEAGKFKYYYIPGDVKTKPFVTSFTNKVNKLLVRPVYDNRNDFNK